MIDTDDIVEKKTDRVYQKQKLYIEELEVNESLDTFEKELKMFLSKYGNIIDIKILQNSNITREAEVLCIRDF